MPINTDLSTAPYNDDLDQLKNFYRILFKPGVSVQVREMNQLQSLIQQQIERFGNNIFKRGTIIDGCNFIQYDNYPYVKILDAQIDGNPSIPGSYVGNFVKNSSNLVAYILDAEDGFESTDPDLKTIFVKYINSGNTGNLTSFASGQALTVYDANNGVQKVTITNGGTQFSNSDSVVFMSAMSVNVTSGSFTVGNIIEQVNDTYTAYAEITEVNTTFIPDTTILKLKHRESDLVNSSINSLAWTFTTNTSIANSTTIADIIEIYGTGASAEIITNGSGKITTVSVTNGGNGYIISPYTSVKSRETRLSLGSLSLAAQTYICQIRVASVTDSVGNGYAFGVTEGVIYQKGHFVRVSPQTVIVDKYSNSPNNLSVAFETEEEIIDSNIDTSLLDNVLGTENENAPGADRLKLTPTLVVLTTSDITGNDDVFPICEWSDGQPYKQNQKTSYDNLGDELATRTNDESGNYVKDRFLITTRSPANSALDANTVAVVVDPGTAYVSGYRTQTLRNYVVEIDKGIDTNVVSNNYVSLNYGNYVKVNELAGVFQFNTADTVDLYYSATGGTKYITNTNAIEAGTVTPNGTKIGTARLRNLVLDEGLPGTNTAIYNMYLFDVQMNPGQNFANTRSIYYNGTSYKGIADVVLSYDATTDSNIAKLNGITNDKLLFYMGYDSPKNANQIFYQYRTIDQTAQITNGGNVVITLAATDEYFPYSNTLSDAQESDIIIMPIGGDLIGANKLTGTISVTTTSPNVTGSSTTFLSDLTAGDYIYMSGNTTQSDIKRVERVVNNTLLILDSNLSFTNTAANTYMCFPKYVPIPINERDGYTSNVDVTGKSLRIYLNEAFTAAGNTNVAVIFNVERRDATQTQKTVKRDIFVKIQCNTAVETTQGPWCLGVPDIIRLKKVYVSNTSTVNTSSTDLTDRFYIDHNQTQNYYGLGYLYKDPYIDLDLNADAMLLVQFDALETSGSGFYTVASYVSTNAATLFEQDSNSLSNSTTSINTFEVPELYDAKGQSYDLINYIDFRPYAANTANLALTVGGATINPSETVSFGNTADPTNNKKFPVPDGILRANVEIWQGRTDAVFLDKSGRIFVERGIPGQNNVPIIPKDAMLLNTLVIPPYPALPKYTSNNIAEILDKRIANERYSTKRVSEKQIITDLAESELARYQPIGYTMADIGNLERRIEDLEYYTSLSLLESSIKDKVIPSSISPNINRFKFGFFIDDYSTLNYTDIDNPEYSADVEETKVVPKQEVTVIHYPVENPPYENFLCIQQKQATSNGANVATPTNTVNVSVYAKQQDKHKKGPDNDPIIEPPVTVTMSSIASTSTLWLHFMDGSDEIYVYQGNTLIATGDDAQKITDAEKKELLKDSFFRTNTGGPGGINDPLDNGSSSGAVGTGTHRVKKAGKIVISHNPSGGRVYTVQVKKTSKVWRFRWDYPIDDTSSVTPSTPSTTAKKPKYRGHVIRKTYLQPISLVKVIEKIAKKEKDNNRKNKPLFDTVIKKLAEVTTEQKVEIEIIGLKPLTQHKLYVREVDETGSCDQKNPSNGVMPPDGQLITDEFGGLDFTYLYSPSTGSKIGNNSYSTNLEELQDLNLLIINSDGSSKASVVIRRKVQNEEDLINAVNNNN